MRIGRTSLYVLVAFQQLLNLSPTLAADGGAFPLEKPVNPRAMEVAGGDECFARFLVAAEDRYTEIAYRNQMAAERQREIVEDARGALIREWRRIFLDGRGEAWPQDLIDSEAADIAALRRYEQEMESARIGRQIEADLRRADPQRPVPATDPRNTDDPAALRASAGAPSPETPKEVAADGDGAASTVEPEGGGLLAAIEKVRQRRPPREEVEPTTESTDGAAYAESAGANSLPKKEAPKTRKVRRVVRVPIKGMRPTYPDPGRKIEEFVQWATKNVIVREEAFVDDRELIDIFILNNDFKAKSAYYREMREMFGRSQTHVDAEIRELRTRISARAQEMAREAQANADVPWRRDHQEEVVIRHEERIVFDEAPIEEAPPVAAAEPEILAETPPAAAAEPETLADGASTNGTANVADDTPDVDALLKAVSPAAVPVELTDEGKSGFMNIAKRLKLRTFAGEDYAEEIIANLSPNKAIALMETAIGQVKAKFPNDVAIIDQYIVNSNGGAEPLITDTSVRSRMSRIRAEIAAHFDGAYRAEIYGNGVIRDPSGIAAE